MEAESHHKTPHCLIYERQQAPSEVRAFFLPFKSPKQELGPVNCNVDDRGSVCAEKWSLRPAPSGVSPAVMNPCALFRLGRCTYFVKI